MSYTNLNFGLITYEDQNVTNPTVRSVDISRSMTGVPVTAEKTDRIDKLRSGESRVIASTLRGLSHDNTTGYNIIRPIQADISTVRLIWNGTGTAPAFAPKRVLGQSATSSVAITRLNSATATISCTDFNTSAVQVGDTLKFEKSTDSFTSVFSVINQAEFKVVSKGANSIDVLDNGVMSVETAVLGSNFDFQIRCYGAPVARIGDTLEINGSGQNPQNVGKFEVREVSPDYVTIVNPYAVELSFVNTDNVHVYDRLIGIVCIRASGVVSVSINNALPFKMARIGGNEALFIGSLSAYKIELLNEEQADVSATVHYSSFS